ncbi:MAG: hypothetical protein H0X17_16850, partial [Deltaproteobacteria bacterium]|nr:hypothetical protein [Deltaproteobacteria bacterium]
IHADDVATARATAHAGVWALVAGLAFTPLLWWIAPAQSEYVAVLTALFLVNLVVLLHSNLAATPRPGLVVIANTLIVVMSARMFSPLMIAPGVAAVLAMAMVLTPKFSFLGSAWTICALLVVAVLGPLALERFDVISRTMSVDANGVLFGAPAFGGHEGATIVVGVLYSSALIIGACTMAGTMRRRAREARHHLQLQAWQLRQLVPQH